MILVFGIQEGEEEDTTNLALKYSKISLKLSFNLKTLTHLIELERRLKVNREVSM